MAVTGLLWGIAWVPLGLIIGVLSYFRSRSHTYDVGPAPSFVATVALTSLFFAVVGAISGAVFALILAMIERRKTLEQLRFRRLITWGVVGSVITPAILIAVIFKEFLYPGGLLDIAVVLSGAGGLGGVSAAATLRAASVGHPGKSTIPPAA